MGEIHCTVNYKPSLFIRDDNNTKIWGAYLRRTNYWYINFTRTPRYTNAHHAYLLFRYRLWKVRIYQLASWRISRYVALYWRVLQHLQRNGRNGYIWLKDVKTFEVPLIYKWTATLCHFRETKWPMVTLTSQVDYQVIIQKHIKKKNCNSILVFWSKFESLLAFCFPIHSNQKQWLALEFFTVIFQAKLNIS